MRRALSAASLLVAALIAPAAQANASTLVVGHDPQACRDAQYQSINEAVIAAAPGDTIRVCPGTYPEHVVVSKPLTLRGAGAGDDARNDGAQPDAAKQAIVVNDGTGGFDVPASNVTISGFTVLGTPPATGYPDAGIYVRAGQNRHIYRNVLRGNGLGVCIENGQDALQVDHNLFLQNTRGDNPYYIPSGGLFAAGGGQIINSAVDFNLFRNNDQFAMNFGTSSQGLEVAHNPATDESTVLVLGNAADAQVTHNLGESIDGSAILLFGNTQRADVELNQMTGRGASDTNGGSGIRTRTEFGAASGNDAAFIAHNKMSGFTFDGFNLNDLTSSRVSDNQTTDNARYGLHLRSGSTGDKLTGNDVRNNAVDGIHVDEQASGNSLTANHASGSGSFDCYDSTAGAGTGGTANLWTDDFGRTENRPGLCRSAGRGD